MTTPTQTVLSGAKHTLGTGRPRAPAQLPHLVSLDLPEPISSSVTLPPGEVGEGERDQRCPGQDALGPPVSAHPRPHASEGLGI